MKNKKGSCKTANQRLAPVLQEQPLKKACFEPVGRETAKPLAKLLTHALACGFCKRLKSLAILPVAAVFMLAACGQGQGLSLAEGGSRIVVDVWGREVRIPQTVNTIVTLGPGAPRIAAYLNVMDMLVGSEEYDRHGIVVLRDYNPVHHELFAALPAVGAGGGSGNNNAFPEQIITVAPDVIIAAFERDAADELQAQTGVPVVSVRHTTGLANETFAAAVRVFAEVVGARDRAEFLLSSIEALKDDLHSRTAQVPQNERLRAYAGAVTFNGRRGFGGTYAAFGPLAAINAYNVADEAAPNGFILADFERVIVWDPDVIFLDPGNMDLVNHEYQINPAFFRSLRAVQEGRVYTMPAFNFAGTNITYALINAYFAGTVLFPDQFADIDIGEKAARVLYLFLGKNTFDIMANYGLFYGSLTIGE